MTFRSFRFAASMCCALALSACSQGSGQDALVGTWAWTMPDTSCRIVRTYHADGTGEVVNGEKRTQGRYEVRTDRDSGMSTVTYTVARDDGGRNCDGESGDTTGRLYMSFFEASGSTMTMCIGPQRDACVYGPYRRQ
ncbi:hypothetical protein ACQQ2N_06050 [Dokdonella sp. MW10]|uniref:hypothetical protein n=1 Tax=Dokdonella sp. MW10 TaxID=2992926 RepID=UPI003F81413F